MNKIRVNNLSQAHTAKGHGVASVYDEQVGLLKNNSKIIDIIENGKWTDCDLNVIHTINLGYRKAARSKKIPSLTFCHFLPNTLKGSIKLGPLTPIFKGYVKRFYKKAQNLILVNKQMLNDLIKMGCKPERLHIVPNSINTKTFYKVDSKTRKEWRNKIGLKENEFVFISTGQVQKRKGVDTFIEVAKKLEHSHPHIKFMWVGGFSFKISAGRKKYEAIMKNPPSNVIFTGMVDREEINNYYNAADALFFPSNDETFGMSIIEAMAVGLPALLKDIPPYRDTFAGHYMMANNATEFVLKILELQDKIKYDKWSKLSSICVKQYTEDNALKLWEEIIVKTIEQHKKGRGK